MLSLEAAVRISLLVLALSFAIAPAAAHAEDPLPAAPAPGPAARATAAVQSALDHLAAGRSDEARRALQEALVELGRVQEDADLRAWIELQAKNQTPPSPVPSGAATVPLPAASPEEAGAVAGTTPATDSPEAPLILPVSAERLDRVVRAIESASFNRAKMDALVRELKDAHVTAVQAGRLVELFSFSRDRVDALLFLHPLVVDPENFEALLSALKFESDRQAVRAQLGLDG
jgi:hypothetical protein